MTTKKQADKDFKDELKQNAEKVWMAGLGALATAEEEGGKLFRGLVKKGETYEKKGLAQFEKLKAKVEGAAEIGQGSRRGGLGQGRGQGRRRRRPPRRPGRRGAAQDRRTEQERDLDADSPGRRADPAGREEAQGGPAGEARDPCQARDDRQAQAHTGPPEELSLAARRKGRGAARKHLDRNRARRRRAGGRRLRDRCPARARRGGRRAARQRLGRLCRRLGGRLRRRQPCQPAEQRPDGAGRSSSTSRASIRSFPGPSSLRRSSEWARRGFSVPRLALEAIWDFARNPRDLSLPSR